MVQTATQSLKLSIACQIGMAQQRAITGINKRNHSEKRKANTVQATNVIVSEALAEIELIVLAYGVEKQLEQVIENLHHIQLGS